MQNEIPQRKNVMPLTVPDDLNEQDQRSRAPSGVSYRGTNSGTSRGFETLDRSEYPRALFASGGRLQRVCFLLNVRPDKLEEYKARHREVWPEMLEALRNAGWSNYSLFLRQDGLLVGYLETPNFEQAVAEMHRRDVNQRWQREMAPYFILPNGSGPDQLMIPLEEIFHIDAHTFV